jgi:hypothetical protein
MSDAEQSGSMSNEPTVSRLINAAFDRAAAQRPERHQQWVTLSYRLGGALPNSKLTPGIQSVGHLDLLLYALEDEAAREIAGGTARPLLSFHQQMMLSEHFVGASYEILRTLAQRDRDATKGGSAPAPRTKEFQALLTDLGLVRIVLDKHELPKDTILKSTLEMAKVPPSGEARDRYVYDKSDSQRAHIMPTGLTSAGSVCWQVIDLRSDKSYWVERQDLASRMLTLIQPVEVIEG